MDTDVQAVIDRVKIQTVMHQPFFGAGATKMRWFADDTIATACTDGKVIRFNPDFLLSLNKHEQVGLCVHEVMRLLQAPPASRQPRPHPVERGC